MTFSVSATIALINSNRKKRKEPEVPQKLIDLSKKIKTASESMLLIPQVPTATNPTPSTHHFITPNLKGFATSSSAVETTSSHALIPPDLTGFSSSSSSSSSSALSSSSTPLLNSPASATTPNRTVKISPQKASPMPRAPSRAHAIDPLFESPQRSKGIGNKHAHSVITSPSAGIFDIERIQKKWDEVNQASQWAEKHQDIPPAITASPNTKIRVPEKDRFVVERTNPTSGEKKQREYALHRHDHGKALYPRRGDDIIQFKYDKKKRTPGPRNLAQWIGEFKADRQSPSPTSKSPQAFLNQKLKENK